MMPWLLAGLATAVLALAALAATGRFGEMPEPPVEDEWIEPREQAETAAREPIALDRDTPSADAPDLSLPDAG